MPTFIKKVQCAEERDQVQKTEVNQSNGLQSYLKLDGFEELSVDKMMEVLHKNLQDAMDALAPIKSRTILVRTMNPWLNGKVRDQKRG